VRITVELIQVRNQAQLWADSFEREVAGILALQSEVARKVAGSLALKLLPEEQARLAGARRVNPEAYDACLKGFQLVNTVVSQDIDTGLEYFERALRKDPSYALAYVGIADVWMIRNQVGYTATNEARPKARAAALKAVELDSGLAQAHGMLATLDYFMEWDWAGAEAEFKRAIELNPNLPDAWALYPHFLAVMKRPAEAIPLMQRVLELDPLNPAYRAWYAAVLEMTGRDDEAIVPGLNLSPVSNPGAGQRGERNGSGWLVRGAAVPMESASRSGASVIGRPNGSKRSRDSSTGPGVRFERCRPRQAAAQSSLAATGPGTL